MNETAKVPATRVLTIMLHLFTKVDFTLFPYLLSHWGELQAPHDLAGPGIHAGESSDPLEGAKALCLFRGIIPQTRKENVWS